MLILLALILPLTSFAFPFSSQPRVETIGNTLPITTPKLPNLLEPIVYHDFWFYCLQFLDNYARWAANQTRERVGSYTNNLNWQPLIPLVYASTTDTIGSTSGTTNGPNVLFGYAITASASGSLSSIGVNVKTTASGNVRLGIYSTLTGTPTFTGLLGQSASVSAPTGWVDAAVIGVTIVQGITYYLAVVSDENTIFYANASAGTEYYKGITYGSLPDPTPTLTSDTTTANMRMTYSSAQALSATPSDALNQLDSLGRNLVGKRSNADAGSVADVIAKLRNVPKSFSDVLSFTDTLARLLVGERTLTDMLSLTDSLSKLRNVPTSLSDTVAWVDSLAFKFVGARTLADVLVFTDALTGLRNVPKSLSDVLSLTDSLSFRYIGARSLADILAFTDTLARLRNVPTSLADILSFVDALAFKYVGSRSLTDALSLTDTISRLRNTPNSLSDILVIADSLTFKYIGVRTLSDAITFVDSLTYLRNIPKSLTNTLSLTDVLSKVLIAQRSFTEAISLTDSLTYLRNVPTSISDVLAFLDNLSRAYVGQRANTDILSLADQLTHTSGKPLTDTVSFADILSYLLVAKRNPTESISISDILSHLIGKPVTDILTLSDILARSYAGLRGATDISALIDALSIGVGKPLAESLVISDSLSRLFTGQLSLNDIIQLVDVFNTGAVRLASLTEQLQFTDTILRQYSGQTNLNELLILTDNLVAYAPGVPSAVSITIQDLFNLNDLLSKLLIPSGFTGTGGGVGATISPLVQIQLAAIPRIATLDYIATNPMSIQTFLFQPSSIVQVLFTANNNNKTAQVVQIWFSINLDGKPYVTTPKAQESLSAGVPTSLYSWLLIDQPGTYEIIPHVEALPSDPNFQPVNLPTQTVVVDLWQIYLASVILWLAILIPIIAVTVFTTRAILARKAEEKEAEASN